MIRQRLTDQVRSVAARWRESYGRHRFESEGEAAIQRRLDALDVETAGPEDVAAIIGNDSWVRPQKCNECGVATWDAVELGEPLDYDSATATICSACLRKALELLERPT